MGTLISMPEPALVAMTRGLLGGGIALLLADKLDASQRRAAGWTLVGVGVAKTIPLLLEVLRGAVAAQADDAQLRNPGPAAAAH